MNNSRFFQHKKGKELLIFSAVAGLLSVGVWLLDFNGLYGQDSHAYLDYSKRLHRFIADGTPAGAFFWSKAYPFLGAIISLSGVSELLALRLISFVSLIGSLTLAYRLCLMLYKETSVVYFVLGGLTQIYFVRSGFLVMSDMLAAFLCLLVIFAYFQWKKSAQEKFFWLMLVAGLCGVFVRYAVAPFMLLPLLLGSSLWLKRQLLVVRVLVVVVGVAGIGILISANNRLIQEAVYRMSDWSLRHAFSRVIHSRDGTVTNTVPNALYVWGNCFHLGYLSFGVVLLPFYKRLTSDSKRILLFCAVYWLFLIGMNTQNYRFLVLTHLPALIALFPAFKAWMQWRPQWSGAMLAGVLALNVAFGYYSFGKTWKAHRQERTIVAAIKKHAHQEAIYSFYVDQSFPSYGLNNRVHNFFLEDFRQIEQGALVVFNERMFAEQWKGQRVMKNWKRLQQSQHLDTLEILTDNWIIYRIR